MMRELYAGSYCCDRAIRFPCPSVCVLLCSADLGCMYVDVLLSGGRPRSVGPLPALLLLLNIYLNIAFFGNTMTRNYVG